jgi:predicted MPP superfamily phosphohydrolase
MTFAGHTHGGQIRLALTWPVFVPSKYGARFA